MNYLVDILGCFGDEKSHYKESVYEVIRNANLEKKWTVRFIDRIVKKYIEYGLIIGDPDTLFKGYYKWKITPKGIAALDFYRNQRHRDPKDGVLF
jgi:hypothetical protein